jgi:trimeric autotransporter adhesin
MFFYFYNLLINSRDKRQLNLNLNYKLMSIITKSNIATKIAIGAIAVAFVFGLMFTASTPAHAALTTSQIDAIISLLESFGADAATISNVQTSLEGGTPTATTGGSTASVCPYTWSVSLTTGASGADVMALQKFLNSDSATQIASSGVGSPGSETDYFGGLTSSAVAKFQNKYASEVLTPVGLSAGTGYFGSSSRAKANSLCAVASTETETETETEEEVATAGTGLTATSATQPAVSLAPESAARVPFTNFTVTAGSDGDVTLESVTVERTGLAASAAFAGVVLLDSDGVMIGTSKTLNSNDQATVGEDVVIPAGTSRTFTVGGNMAADNSTRAGQVAGLDVVAVNTSATVTGSLPIEGADHTINSTLTIGAATMAVSSFDPNSAQSKEIGTTEVRVAGVQLTAGSAEDVRIRNLRWNQTGSAGTTDITNVITVVDGTEYPTTLSADGNYYTANIGSGVVVGKGNSIDMYVKVDIISGSARTVIMDIDKATDIYVTGETFGYGITATQSQDGTAGTTSSVFTSGTPFFDNATMTISAGSVTSIQKSSDVAAQNIAVNVSNQPLGAFETDIKGEAINISGVALTVASTTGSGTGLLTNVTIVDENGSVVAGPVDATYTSALVQTVTFTDSMTIPTGTMVYSVKGKVASAIGNGGTYIVTVTPSGWTSPTGDVTGDSITISNTAFTLNTMTVKSAALDISIASTPVAQNITAGTQDFTFSTIQLDATQSGEDVRFSSIPLEMVFATLTADQVTNCQIMDGSSALNTGSNVPSLSSSATTGFSTTFTFDETLTVSKGTVKELDVVCDLSSGTAANDSLSWGIDGSPSITVTGVTSSNSVTETVTASVGQTMTVAAVSLVASEDSTSPSYAIVEAGSTDVEVGTINFRAANEAVTLQRVGLTLTNSASSSSTDLVQVTLWDGTTQVGTAIFTGSNTNATSTLSTAVDLAKDADTDITVKADLASIGTSEAGSQGALIAVDVDTNGTNTQGVGQDSGTTVNASGSTTFSGVRMMSSVPTVATDTGSLSTTLTTSSGVDLYRFSVTSSDDGNGIGLTEVTVNLSTSTGAAVSGTTTVTNLEVYAYTDSGYSSPVSGFTNGQIVATVAGLVSSGDNAAALSSVLQIPEATTYYFKVVGDVALTAGSGTFSGSVTTRISGDAAYPAISGLMSYAATVQADTNDDFVWSPNATTSSLSTHLDWSNGYSVSGLPSAGTDAFTISK